MLGAIAGYDQMDPTSADAPVPDYSRAVGMQVSKLRLGIPRHPFFDNLDSEIGKAVDAGMLLPNVNDGYTGRAPDLGAWELGRPVPVYGPRTKGAKVEE